MSYRKAKDVLTDSFRWLLFVEALEPKVAAQVRAKLGPAAAPDPDWTRWQRWRSAKRIASHAGARARHSRRFASASDKLRRTSDIVKGLCRNPAPCGADCAS